MIVYIAIAVAKVIVSSAAKAVSAAGSAVVSLTKKNTDVLPK